MSRSRQAIGIDIGGTKMAIALVSEEGAILDRAILPTEADLGFGRAVERLGDRIEQLPTLSKRRNVTGIGIGCAGPVDPGRGLINNPYTLAGWDQCNIVAPLRDRFGVPVYLENDADVAAMGECWCGAGKGFDPVVMLTFGTGIGGAAVAQGQVYRGVNGEHPELGHIPVDPDGPRCYCGIRGCLESIASGTAIGLAGQSIGLETARAVFTAANQGNPVAQEIINRAVTAASIAAWAICHTLLPQRLVLGGGIMEEHFDLFAGAMKEKLKPATQFSQAALSIARATLGNEAGIVGAAGMALQRA